MRQNDTKRYLRGSAERNQSRHDAERSGGRSISHGRGHGYGRSRIHSHSRIGTTHTFPGNFTGGKGEGLLSVSTSHNAGGEVGHPDIVILIGLDVEWVQ